MKRVSFFIGMLMLALGASFMASADDNLQLDAGLAEQESATSITWPMLPGESVNDLARMFYPKNSAMQQRFISKTLQLNADIKSSQRFESPTLLVIPTLKSLSIKTGQAGRKSNKQALNMSYGLKRVIQLAPEKLQQEYEELVAKNAFLKQQLVKLNEKIVVLQAKLDDLKLIFDKTLTLPNTNLPAPNKAPAEPVSTTAPVSTTQPISESSMFDILNMDLVKAVIAAAVLLLLGALVLKKYRERMFAQLSFAATKMQGAITDLSGNFERTILQKEDTSPETVQQQQMAKAVETKLSATLEEAKLLMSVNRGADAIAHLKMTIESQPNASINHWLYLLEVFRRLNLKAEFEDYADRMHKTFNVMTPVWYEKEAAATAAIVVPQSLEEFPHIMGQLYGVWPGELASVYLRSLVTDNRGGERIGFSKAVVEEILFLIELLDSYKDIPN